MEKIPRVGLGVAVIRNGKVLVGQRHNAHGDGAWCFPGGHLEFGESFEKCAEREVREETGLTIQNIRYITATNDFFESAVKHYVTIYMQADWKSGIPQVLEPEKMDQWQWRTIDELPKPLFLPLQHLLQTGYAPNKY